MAHNMLKFNKNRTISITEKGCGSLGTTKNASKRLINQLEQRILLSVQLKKTSPYSSFHDFNSIWCIFAIWYKIFFGSGNTVRYKNGGSSITDLFMQ